MWLIDICIYSCPTIVTVHLYNLFLVICWLLEHIRNIRVARHGGQAVVKHLQTTTMTTTTELRLDKKQSDKLVTAKCVIDSCR